jgi:hypothetical protein
MRGGRADDDEDSLPFSQSLRGDLGMDESSANSTDTLLDDLRNLIRSDFTAGGAAENTANPSDEFDEIDDVDKRHQNLKAEEVRSIQLSSKTRPKLETIEHLCCVLPSSSDAY